jgi:hypothetical protein
VNWAATWITAGGRLKDVGPDLVVLEAHCARVGSRLKFNEVAVVGERYCEFDHSGTGLTTSRIRQQLHDSLGSCKRAVSRADSQISS